MELETNEQKNVIVVQQLRTTVRELYELLEQYAPAWYTREHRTKTEAALRFRSDTPIVGKLDWQAILELWPFALIVLTMIGAMYLLGLRPG